MVAGMAARTDRATPDVGPVLPGRWLCGIHLGWIPGVRRVGRMGTVIMFNRRMALLAGAMVLCSPAHARALAEDIAAQLRSQGFSAVTIQRTLLGREQITGARNGGSREIIVNPNTGEILRDLWLNSDGKVQAAGILSRPDEPEDDPADDPADGSADDAADGSGHHGGGSGSGNGGREGNGDGGGEGGSGEGGGGGGHGGGGDGSDND